MVWMMVPAFERGLPLGPVALILLTSLV